MKKISTILFIFISFYSCAQDFSTIFFIGRGSPANSYDISINDQLIGTIKGMQTLEYKMHREGGISVVVLWNGNPKKSGETMTLKHGETYYFECYGVADKEVGKLKGKAILKETQNTIKGEEGKDAPVKTFSAAPAVSIASGVAEQGTCFAINRKGYLITNYHLVKNAKEIHVKGIGGDFSTLYVAEVISYDTELDLALIKIKNQAVSFDSIPYRLSVEMSSVGTKSFVTGYPAAGAGDTIMTTEGVISARSGSSGSSSQYQFSQALQAGSSGSPFFNDKGDVIGIINTNFKEKEGTSYAVKSSYIFAFLMSTDNVPLEIAALTTRDLTPTDKIARFKNYIFIVKAE